jgi:glutaredoxin
MSMPTASRSAFPWAKLLMVAAVLWGGWVGLHKVRDKRGAPSSIGATFGSDLSAADITRLASTVQANEVVMYSTTECQYCTQAKSWLGQNGFAFTECNMSVESHCETEFRSYGGNGTPYLVVNRAGKTHHMKNGFDSDEFLAALAP